MFEIQFKVCLNFQTKPVTWSNVVTYAMMKIKNKKAAKVGETTYIHTKTSWLEIIHHLDRYGS